MLWPSKALAKKSKEESILKEDRGVEESTEKKRLCTATLGRVWVELTTGGKILERMRSRPRKGRRRSG